MEHTWIWLGPGMGPTSSQGGLGLGYKAFSGESMCQHQQHLEAPASSQHTPLGAQGLYIQTLLPGSPAASDGRLSLGDQILEVNGSSLRGVSYMRAVDLIRHGGKKMRFLVAKSDMETAKKIRFRNPPS